MIRVRVGEAELRVEGGSGLEGLEAAVLEAKARIVRQFIDRGGMKRKSRAEEEE